jgi:hypothetical protein
MTTFIIGFAAALLLLAAALAGAFTIYRRRGLSAFLRRTVVVHTKDAKSFRGVLAVEYADCIVLEQAEHLDENIILGGRLVLLRGNVSWAQDVTSFPRPDATTSPSDRFEVSRDEVQ